MSPASAIDPDVVRMLESLRAGRVVRPGSPLRRLWIRWHARRTCRRVLRALACDDVPAVAERLARLPPAARWPWRHLAYAIAEADLFLHRPPRSPRDQCLPRSLVHARYLWMAGLPATVHIGLYREGQAEGHAWATVGEHLVLEEPERIRAFCLPLSRTPLLAYWLADPAQVEDPPKECTAEALRARRGEEGRVMG